MQLPVLATENAGLAGTMRRLTIDHIWIITVLVLASLFISVLPLPPNDLWWHMAAGRIMVDEGVWLQTNRWAYTLSYDAPYVYQSWLSEVLLYALWWLGDVPLLTLTRTTVIAASYGLVAWHAWRRTDQGKAVALTLALAVLIGWNNWTLRPQTLALLPGAAFIVVLDSFLIRRTSARTLIALPILMMVWVNLHGSFILGACMLVLAWLGLALGVVRSAPSPDRAVWKRLQALSIAGLATLLATMVHPLGIGVFGYVRELLTDTPSQTRIVEWQPPTNTISFTNTGFWFYLVLLLVVVIVGNGRRKPSASDLLWFCGLAWLTIGGVRYAMWFALAIMPFLSEQLGTLFKQRRPVPATTAFTAMLTLLFGSALVATLPWFEPGRFIAGGEDLFANTGRYRMLLGRTTPVGATEWLAHNPIEGRFWVDMSYSSYTIWELPHKQVFADLRVDMFPDDIWNDYFAINGGGSNSLRLLDKWRVTHLMLDAGGQQKLYQLLNDTPGWCERYADSNSIIMARCSS